MCCDDVTIKVIWFDLTNSSTSWMAWGWVHFQKMFIFRLTIASKERWDDSKYDCRGKSGRQIETGLRGGSFVWCTRFAKSRHACFFFHTASLLFVGDSRWGGNECVTGTEGGISGDRRVPLCFAAALPPDPQHHRSGEELHHHFPSAYWHDAGLHEALN